MRRIICLFIIAVLILGAATPVFGQDEKEAHEWGKSSVPIPDNPVHWRHMIVVLQLPGVREHVQIPNYVVYLVTEYVWRGKDGKLTVSRGLGIRRMVVVDGKFRRNQSASDWVDYDAKSFIFHDGKGDSVRFKPVSMRPTESQPVPSGWSVWVLNRAPASCTYPSRHQEFEDSDWWTELRYSMRVEKRYYSRDDDRPED